MHQRSNQSIWQYLRQHRLASLVVGHLVLASVLGLALFSSAFGTPLFGASAQSSCASGARTYVVVSGDTLGTIASRNNVTWQSLASYNKLANPNAISIAQRICIPGKGTTTTTTTTTTTFSNTTFNQFATRGFANPYPYGQCTWYANQRFRQLRGFYVPWTSNANAWQWIARAQDYRWKISSAPSIGSILVLQPNVQGASGLGHVGVVEQVLGNGRVIASSMNWGANPSQVSSMNIVPGPGVSFVTV